MGLSAALNAEQGSGGRLTADDYVEIQQLYAQYAHALDLGDAQAWADTFTSDGVFSDAKGREELVAFAKGFDECFSMTGSLGNKEHSAIKFLQKFHQVFCLTLVL